MIVNFFALSVLPGGGYPHLLDSRLIGIGSAGARLSARMRGDDGIGTELGRIGVHYVAGKTARRGGDRADGVGDATHSGSARRLGAFPMKRPCVAAAKIRVATASRQRCAACCSVVPVLIRSSKIDYCAITHLADQEIAGDDPAAAPLFDTSRWSARSSSGLPRSASGGSPACHVRPTSRTLSLA